MALKKKKKSWLERLRSILSDTGEVLLINTPGMRIQKTALAVVVCLIVDQLRCAPNYYDAAIAAIVCLQNDVRSTIRSALDRTLGTLFAGVYTIAFLWICRVYAHMSVDTILYHLLIGIFLIPLMQILVKLTRPGAVAIGSIVFVLICVSETALDDPILYVTRRVWNTIVGILIALLINWLPPLNNFEAWFNRIKRQAKAHHEQEK